MATKLRANQINIQDVVTAPAAQATETSKGTLRIATQAEVNGGSPYDNTIVVTPQTLANFGGFDNWIYANNGADFSTAPSGTGTNAVAIGNNAVAAGTSSVTIGSGVSSTSNYTISIGHNSSGTAVGTINIGFDCDSVYPHGIAIGYQSKSTATSGMVVGDISTVSAISGTVIGNEIATASTPTNPAYATKIGYGAANANKNLLFLHDKGKLELLGDEAQFVFPNYRLAGSPLTNPLPSTTIQGGTVYDDTDNVLKFYNGAAWTALAVETNWLHANNGSDFGTAPTGTGADSIALGNSASTGSAYGAIALGTNVTAAINAVSIGPNSDALGTASIAIGSGTQTSVSGTGVAIGSGCQAAGASTVVIGVNSSAVSQKSVVLGYDSDTDFGNQVAIGNLCKSSSVTSDVIYSVKLGEGGATVNKNMLHLFSKGKLELYGDSAQFIMPNYVMGSPAVEPETATEGGLIYDSTAQGLKLYNGVAWTAAGATTLNDLTDVTIPGSPPVAEGEVLTYQTGTWVNSNTLTANLSVSVAEPVAAGDLTRKDYVDALLDILYESPTQIGTELLISGSFPAITAINSTDVVHISETIDSLQTYRFDGSVWSTFGNALDLGVVIPSGNSLATLNSTDIVFGNFSGAVIQAYRFNTSGSPVSPSWAPLGNSFSISGFTTGLSLAALTSTDIVYFDQNRNTIRTYRFTGGSPGGTWSQVGNALSVTSATVGMVALNSTDIAYVDSTTDSIRTYRFDGTDWAQVGNTLSLTGANSPSLAKLNGTDVVVTDTTSDAFRMLRFDGTDWKLVGGPHPIVAMGTPSITTLTSGTTADIAFIDGSNRDLTNYRAGAIAGTVEFTAFIDDRFVNSGGDSFSAVEIDITGELKTTSISETSVSYGTTGSQSLDLTTGTYFYPTATAGSPAITFSFTNVGGGSPATRVYSFTLELSGAGDFAPTWPGGVKWPGGTEPTWTTVAGSPIVNGPDIVSFVTRDGGTTWLGMLGGLAFK